MRIRRLTLLTALALNFGAGLEIAQAHHSGAMFDHDKVVSITGVVREFNWTNPHSSFKVEVPGEGGGAPVLWGIEMNAPANLMHDGWKRNTLKAGDRVTVKLNPLRDGGPGGSYVSIKLPDGTELAKSD
jgi:hypothetical protein